jgi:hypothetical protein
MRDDGEVADALDGGVGHEPKVSGLGSALR